MRLAGGVLGAVPGVLLVLGGLTMAGSPSARASALAVGGVALALGAGMGALFGPSAARGGTDAILEWAVIIAGIAVPTGAIAIAAWMVPWGSGISIQDAVTGIVVVAAIGLIVFGPPVGAIVLLVTFVWAALLRAVVTRMPPIGVESTSPR